MGQHLQKAQPGAQALLPVLGAYFRRDLPPDVAATLWSTQVGQTAGPLLLDGSFDVVLVHGKEAAQLDAPTRAAIERLLVETSLDEMRSRARVEWNWGEAEHGS